MKPARGPGPSAPPPRGPRSPHREPLCSDPVPAPRPSRVVARPLRPGMEPDTAGSGAQNGSSPLMPPPPPGQRAGGPWGPHSCQWARPLGGWGPGPGSAGARFCFGPRRSPALSLGVGLSRGELRGSLGGLTEARQGWFLTHHDPATRYHLPAHCPPVHSSSIHPSPMSRPPVQPATLLPATCPPPPSQRLLCARNSTGDQGQSVVWPRGWA